VLSVHVCLVYKVCAHVCLVLSRVLCQRKKEKREDRERERESREKREKIKERILGVWRYDDHNSTIYKNNNY